MYEAWGQFVSERVVDEIRPRVKPVSTDLFLRIPIRPRLKSDGSFVAKAFYRDKPYANPFDDITDKVGMRVVVLLPADMLLVGDVIENCSEWETSKDRDHEEERRKNPHVFTYQSDHYVVRARGDKTIDGIAVKSGTPCEKVVPAFSQPSMSCWYESPILKSTRPGTGRFGSLGFKF